LTIFCTSAPTSPLGRPCGAGIDRLAPLQVLALDDDRVDHRHDVGHARQLDRRAVLGVGDRQAVELRDVLARAVRQAQLDVDLLAVGRGPPGGDVAVDEAAQARRELRRGEAELAHRIGLEPHRVGRDARLDRGREVGDARHLGDLVAQAQHLGLEHVRVGTEQAT
jgi:hypothetical protein